MFTNNVSVIDVATNNITASVDVGINPWAVAINPEGTKVYVTNANVLNKTPPIPYFSASLTSGKAPLNVRFTDNSTGLPPTSWFWDFGDGTNSTEKNPSHIYSKSGQYTVRLESSNSVGMRSTSKPDYINVSEVV